MPVSEDNPDGETAGQSMAVMAEALYLANLMVAPVLAFLVLLWLYLKRAPGTPPLALCHLRQTVSASLWAGVLLVVANMAIIVSGGYTAPATWVIAILYFTTCHASLVLLGMVGLAKALAGKPYVFPLVGRPCDA